MTKEFMSAKTENIGLPLKIDENAEKKFIELKSNEIKEIEVSEVRVSLNETRFARLKKSLRKRSVSIL